MPKSKSTQFWKYLQRYLNTVVCRGARFPHLQWQQVNGEGVLNWEGYSLDLQGSYIWKLSLYLLPVSQFMKWVQ